MLMSRVEPSWAEVAELITREGRESHVADRIRELREERGWSQTELAARLSAEIAPGASRPVIDRIAIWKLENPDKASGGRRVTIAELIALGVVFDITVAELLLPPGAAHRHRAWTQLHAAAEALNDVRAAWGRYYEAMARTRALLAGDEVFAAQVAEKLVAEKAAFTDSHTRAWVRYGDGSDLAAFADAQTPTPLLATLSDAVSDQELAMDGWATGRTIGGDR